MQFPVAGRSRLLPAPIVRRWEIGDVKTGLLLEHGKPCANPKLKAQRAPRAHLTEASPRPSVIPSPSAEREGGSKSRVKVVLSPGGTSLRLVLDFNPGYGAQPHRPQTRSQHLPRSPLSSRR